MIINKTKSYCCSCQKEHEAQFESIDNKVFFKVLCPIETKSVQISSDSEIFLSIRDKSYCDFSNINEPQKYSWENFVEVTNDCNFSCPACFSTFTEKNKFYLSFPNFLERLSILKKNKRFAITISGGEPTLHPDLFKMIKESTKNGITPKILTNGSVLGKEPKFAKQLKKSGIEYCIIQFDSLNKENMKFIRNNDSLDLKKQALINAKKADLFVGVNSLILKKNLSEIGDLLKYFFEFAPQLSIINFLCAVKSTGRFDFDNSQLVDREIIIKSIIRSNVIKGLNIDNFRPFPKFSPLGINLHPDCLAIAVVAIINNKAEPLDEYIDLDKLYSLLANAKSKKKVRPILGSILFCLLLFRTIKSKKLFSCLKMFFGYIFKRGKNSFAIITIEQFMNEIYQDVQRLKYCTTNIVLENGALVPGCVYYHPDKRRDKNTRVNSLSN
ncbi:MAG: hypothetical protein A2Y34_11600 [Spirochaetes bacterium GWC1_27_15]|nr:MAG: hypothetical protein A2Z98_02280 [Spirochaetes bacterium GWB1_27_13]OHD23310.1 MAG: hypothetical protein A2Y34_11600 [Spirochaetes bacterium GWC1_27_15]